LSLSNMLHAFRLGVTRVSITSGSTPSSMASVTMANVTAPERSGSANVDHRVRLRGVRSRWTQ
jgi:hypothetical protein